MTSRRAVSAVRRQPSQTGNLTGTIFGIVVWLLAMGLTLLGLFDGIANWPWSVAFVQLVWLILAPFFGVNRLFSGYFWEPESEPDRPAAPVDAPWRWSLGLGLLSIGITVFCGWPSIGLPPAYHDEYSYLFQANTFLAGRTSWPLVTDQAETFRQMHILHEDRFVSRYYPGTALFLIPSIALRFAWYGHWLANGVITFGFFWIGRIVAGATGGRITGFVVACSTGMAAFGNLLLSHQPCLLGLTCFLWSMLCLMRRPSIPLAFGAGCGLTCAMFCRPATAAAIGLPWGIWLACWLLKPKFVNEEAAVETAVTDRWRLVAVLGSPVVLGLGFMLGWNHLATGDWRVSPYQLYTQLYTPRHVFGLNNVSRGARIAGPKTIEEYDRWAEELTLENMGWKGLNRLISSAVFTSDPVVILVSCLVLPWIVWRGPAGVARFQRVLPLASIVCLHVLHLFYWFEGIMGWHYVFESGPLWGVLTGILAGYAVQCSKESASNAGIWAVGGIVCGSVLGLIPLPVERGDPPVTVWRSRLQFVQQDGDYPRRSHGQIREIVRRQVGQGPALVLLDQTGHNEQLDLVVNPEWPDGPVLLGRWTDSLDVSQLSSQFPGRSIYRFRVSTGEWLELRHD